MTISDDQLRRYQSNRAERLARTPWLRSDRAGGNLARYVAGEVLVLDQQHGQARDVLRDLGHDGTGVTQDEVMPGVSRLRIHALAAGSTPGTATAIRRVRDRVGQAAAGPNHVFLSSPYEHGGPFGPPAPSAQAYTPGTASGTVRITVVDTGVRLDGPLPREAYDATDADIDESTDDGMDLAHANFITGVILAATDRARVRIVKVLDADGVCSEVDLAQALTALPACDVINLSLGGYTLDNSAPVVLSAAMARLLGGTDRVVVAAAGNDGASDQLFWPAAFAGTDVPWADQVVAVAAHDGANVCHWSNTGDWITFAAPGSDITSTYVHRKNFTSGMAQWSGTSFAAPYVAAAIAARHQTTGSITSALKQLRDDAAGQRFGDYPGLA